jgi:hypothetical protein
MTTDEPARLEGRPGNGLIVGAVVLALLAAALFFPGLSNVQSGECVESCVTAQFVAPPVFLAIAVALFVVGWRRMHL